MRIIKNKKRYVIVGSFLVGMVFYSMHVEGATATESSTQNLEREIQDLKLMLSILIKEKGSESQGVSDSDALALKKLQLEYERLQAEREGLQREEDRRIARERERERAREEDQRRAEQAAQAQTTPVVQRVYVQEPVYRTSYPSSGWWGHRPWGWGGRWGGGWGRWGHGGWGHGGGRGRR